VAWRKARGSIATTYRGVARAEFIGDEWTGLSAEQKHAISKTVTQGLIARIDGALMAETFNSREDRQLSWFALQVDEEGWREAVEVLADAFHMMGRIREDSAERLKASGDSGLTATAGILMFESPEPTPPAQIKKRERERATSREG
jgi:hypothetical protein